MQAMCRIGYFDLNNTTKMKGYPLYNAFVSYTGENYRLSLHGRNLTDEVYVPWSDSNLYRSGSSRAASYY